MASMNSLNDLSMAVQVRDQPTTRRVERGGHLPAACTDTMLCPQKVHRFGDLTSFLYGAKASGAMCSVSKEAPGRFAAGFGWGEQGIPQIPPSATTTGGHHKHRLPGTTALPCQQEPIRIGVADTVRRFAFGACTPGNEVQASEEVDG